MLTIARSQYDDRPSVASDLSFVGDKGVTKQSDLKDTDINSIFRRFEKTGQLPDLIAKDGRYGDFSAVPDYQSALGIIKMANDQFANLDVSVRNRFANDPAQFLGWVNDSKNIDEVVSMGLLTPEATKAYRDAKDAANLAAKKAADEAAAKAAQVST